ncbi:MAG: hypothetical protein J6Y02_02265 [Pseudobutyrivibrio sp.]|nr:hypothetical protein [Pseudobutyrivibrio sp.]
MILQRQISNVTNLIVNMTKKYAKEEEMRRAIDHSLVILKCSKEISNSFEEKNIEELIAKYGGEDNEEA